MQATTIHPTLPVFSVSPPQTGASEPPPAVNGSSTVSTAGALNSITTPKEGVVAEADFFDDDPPAHYPKPGFGLAQNLPPESEHLPWLVDENDEVFSHVFPADEEVPEDIIMDQSDGGAEGSGHAAIDLDIQATTIDSNPGLTVEEPNLKDAKVDGMDGPTTVSHEAAEMQMDVDGSDVSGLLEGDHIVVIEKG